MAKIDSKDIDYNEYYECGYGYAVEHDADGFDYMHDYIVDLSAVCYRNTRAIHIVKDYSAHLAEWEEGEHREETAPGIQLLVPEARWLAAVLTAMCDRMEQEKEDE